MTPISGLVAKGAYFLFMGILLLNLSQKRLGHRGIKKRTASLYLAIAILGVYIGAGAIVHAPRLFSLKLPDLLIGPFLAGVLYILYRYRKKTFPFLRRCPECGKNLPWDRILFLDSNLCKECETVHEKETKDL